MIFTEISPPLRAISFTFPRSGDSPAFMITSPIVLCANVSFWMSLPRITSDVLDGGMIVAGAGVIFTSIGGSDNSTVTGSFSNGLVACLSAVISAIRTNRITIPATNQIQDPLTFASRVSSAF